MRRKGISNKTISLKVTRINVLPQLPIAQFSFTNLPQAETLEMYRE
jgi:hypothetical protein